LERSVIRVARCHRACGLVLTGGIVAVAGAAWALWDESPSAAGRKVGVREAPTRQYHHPRGNGNHEQVSAHRVAKHQRITAAVTGTRERSGQVAQLDPQMGTDFTGGGRWGGCDALSPRHKLDAANQLPQLKEILSRAGPNPPGCAAASDRPLDSVAAPALELELSPLLVELRESARKPRGAFNLTSACSLVSASFNVDGVASGGTRWKRLEELLAQELENPACECSGLAVAFAMHRRIESSVRRAEVRDLAIRSCIHRIERTLDEWAPVNPSADRVDLQPLATRRLGELRALVSAKWFGPSLAPPGRGTYQSPTDVQ